MALGGQILSPQSSQARPHSTSPTIGDPFAVACVLWKRGHTRRRAAKMGKVSQMREDQADRPAGRQTRGHETGGKAAGLQQLRLKSELPSSLVSARREEQRARVEWWAVVPILPPPPPPRQQFLLCWFTASSSCRERRSKNSSRSSVVKRPGFVTNDSKLDYFPDWRLMPIDPLQDPHLHTECPAAPLPCGAVSGGKN